MIKDSITALIAVYSAVIATIGLRWHIYNIVRDRPKIIIKYKKNIKVVGTHNITHPYKPDKDYLDITVINKGRRPVTITKVALMYKQPPHCIVTDSFLYGNVELNEGKSKSYLVEQDLIDFKKLLYIFVYDVTDKVYKKRYRN